MERKSVKLRRRSDRLEPPESRGGYCDAVPIEARSQLFLRLLLSLETNGEREGEAGAAAARRRRQGVALVSGDRKTRGGEGQMVSPAPNVASVVGSHGTGRRVLHLVVSEHRFRRF
ncbi:hypothetical protein JCGZ_13771 [Jatropha curcas]|uniref:Uncharacterized protein n=1 Tax=Jatropha curcas TaxID=180498 RepID=A0A067K746_JATCU|nr:hypothetical protein JCGZ_13771 [Jatropha curcas]